MKKITLRNNWATVAFWREYFQPTIKLIPIQCTIKPIFIQSTIKPIHIQPTIKPIPIEPTIKPIPICIRLFTLTI
jgi:hypothetical protein